MQGPGLDQCRLRPFTRAVIGADQQIPDDGFLRVAQGGDGDDGGEAGPVFADVGQLVDVFDAAGRLEDQGVKAGQ